MAVGWVMAMAFASSAFAEEPDALAIELLAEHAHTIQPLEIEAARRFWDANVHGTQDAYRLKNGADIRLDAALADLEFFRRLKRCHEAKLSDPLVARQIRLLYWQVTITCWASCLPASCTRRLPAKPFAAPTQPRPAMSAMRKLASSFATASSRPVIG